jgi:hypothetical protein
VYLVYFVGWLYSEYGHFVPIEPRGAGQLYLLRFQGQVLAASISRVLAASVLPREHNEDSVTAHHRNAFTTRPRYLNPFEGRKKPIQLSGLFLFDPEVALRLRGKSVRTTFIEMDEESLYKGLERAGRRGQATKSLRDRLLSLLPLATGKAFAAAFDALDAPTHALAQMGPWEAHLMGALSDDNGETPVWPPSAQLLRDVERASRHATALCSEGQSQAASEYLASHSLLQRFMSPEVLHGIAETPNPEDLLVLRLIVALEVWLSVLALWDIEARPDDADDDRSYTKQLLTQDDETAKNTVAQLFDWLLKAANVATPAALMEDPRLREFSVQGGTLGAWSRGTNFPSASYRIGIAKALLSAEDVATFKSLSATARQLNFLGYVAQHLEKVLGKLKGAEAEQGKLLGLGLPFGHDSIEAWMRSRYPVWLQFHRANLAGQAPVSAGVVGQ